MKRIFAFLLIVFSTQCFSRPHASKESAVLRGSLQLVTKEGNPIYTFMYVNDTLTQYQKKDKISSFLFEERMGSGASETYRSIRFTEIKEFSDKCQSKIYTAYSDKRKEKLVLYDNRTRICDDDKLDRWELTLNESKTSERYFRGNPESVAETDCERFVRNNMCPMYYMPVICSVKSVNWEPIEPIATASGSNPCVALGELKKKVCERSYNADKLQDEEVSCAGITSKK